VRGVCHVWAAKTCDRARCNRQPRRLWRYDFTYELARSLCLVGAAAAGRAAIERSTAISERSRPAQTGGAHAPAPATAHSGDSSGAIDVTTSLLAKRRGVGGSAGNCRSVRRKTRVGTIGHKGAMFGSAASRRAQAVLALDGAPMTVSTDADGAGPGRLFTSRRPHRMGPGLRRTHDAG